MKARVTRMLATFQSSPAWHACSERVRDVRLCFAGRQQRLDESKVGHGFSGRPRVAGVPRQHSRLIVAGVAVAALDAHPQQLRMA